MKLNIWNGVIAALLVFGISTFAGTVICAVCEKWGMAAIALILMIATAFFLGALIDEGYEE